MRRIFENQNLNSTLLRGFLAIAKYKNLTRAAHELCCTQSTLSLQLKKLEGELGVKLFERRARGMHMTHAGQVLLPIAESVSANMREISCLFGEDVVAELKIGVPDDFEGSIMEIALAEFGRKYPDVRVHARAGCTSQFEANVRRNELDMAVVSGPDFVGDTPLGKDQNIWVCNRDCAVHMSDSVPLALLDRACWWRHMVTDALNEEGRDWHAAYTTGSFGMTRSAILSGRAVGVWPETDMEDAFQPLTEQNGFPKLPPSCRSIVIADKASEEHVAAMSLSLRAARRRITGLRLPT